MIKNRESACISRQKRKEVSFKTVHCCSTSMLYSPQYVQTLEARLKEAALKNSALLQENTSLRKQMNALEKEVSVFFLCLCTHMELSCSL